MIVTLTLGGPFIGYLRALNAESYVAEVNRQRLVRDLRERVRVGDVLTKTFSFKIDLPAMSQCEYELSRLADQKPQMASEILTHISLSLDQARSEAGQSLLTETSLLNGFSWPKLGAIKGCLDASILAPICERYVRDLYWKVPERERNANNRKWKDLDRRIDNRWCEIAEYLKPRL